MEANKELFTFIRFGFGASSTEIIGLKFGVKTVWWVVAKASYSKASQDLVIFGSENTANYFLFS